MPHPLAELGHGAGQSGQLFLPVGLRFQLPDLLFKLLPMAFQVATASPILVQLHHTGEVGVRQTFELLPQARLATA